MFLSKAFSVLRNPVSKALSQNVEASHRLYSGVATATQKANVENDTPQVEKNASQGVPDKLYKKIEVEVRGNDPAVLKSYVKFTTAASRHLNIKMMGIYSPEKPVHERYTVLKSVHIYKKHRVQYETRTYYRTMDFAFLTGSTADTFLEYIQRSLPEGVAMKVTKVEIQELPESIYPPDEALQITKGEIESKPKSDSPPAEEMEAAEEEIRTEPKSEDSARQVEEPVAEETQSKTETTDPPNK